MTDGWIMDQFGDGSDLPDDFGADLEEPEYTDPDPRLPRGYLALDCDLICKDYHNGKVTLSEGKYLTPYMVGSLLIEETDGTRKRPSSGAIASVFKKWEETGYAEFRKNPYAFVKLTMTGALMGSWQVYQEVELADES